MSAEPELPRAARIFVSFVALLRANGFAVAPEQTTAFLAAIDAARPARPRGYQAGGAGHPRAAARTPRDLRPRCSTSTSAAAKRSSDVDDGEDDETSGSRKRAAATRNRCSPTRPMSPAWPRPRAEALVERRFAAALRRPTRCAAWRARPPGACRGGAATAACARRRGPFADLRRTLRDCVRSDGEILRLGAPEAAPARRENSCC